MVFRILGNLLSGRNKPGSPSKRIIIGVKRLVYDLLREDIAEKSQYMQYTAEHFIRLGIVTEQELDNLHLLQEALKGAIPVRGHLQERKYIAVNRRLHYLIKGYGLRHSMTVKTATEHLICLGIIAEKELEELESIEELLKMGKRLGSEPRTPGKAGQIS